MRNIWLSVIVLAMLVYPAIAGTGAELNVLSQEWDFGSIEQGSSKQMVFLIQNTGFDELVIHNVHACCGYSIDNISSWEIAPGAKAEISITCDASRKQSGEDKRHITIISNSRTNPNMLVLVRANIEPSASSPKGVIKQKVKEQIHPVTRSKDMPAISSIKVDEIYNKIDKGDYIIILDVREREEQSRKHIANSIRFPRSSIRDSEDDFKYIINSIDKKIPIVVCCAGGLRSAYIAAMLKGSGYNSYNMEGGISAWEKAGYPLVFGSDIKPEEYGIPIDMDEAYQYYFLAFADQTLWIDLRDEVSYGQGNIQGAINIPIYDLKNKLDLVPRDMHLVLYCQNKGCDLGKSGSEILVKKGFARGKIRVFEEGIEGWEAAGHPVDLVRSKEN